MVQQARNALGLVPTFSSQTTVVWPLVLREKDERVIGDYVGYDVGSVPIQAPQEKSWDEALEDVLTEYAEAWERLAAL